MRVVIAPDSFGDDLGAASAAEAIAAGWRRVAPADDLALLPGPGGESDPGLAAALDGAGLVVTGEACFDWRSLRGTPVTAVARAAADRGTPCIVLADKVSVGRREAAAVGVDAAYAVADELGLGRPADPAEALAALAARVARSWSP